MQRCKTLTGVTFVKHESKIHNGKTPMLCSSVCNVRYSLRPTRWKLARLPWSERRTCDRKFASSNQGRSGGGIFFSRANFVCWLLFVVRSTPVLPQCHVKDSGHSTKSEGGGLHLNMHTPLTQRSRSGLIMLLHRHSVGTYPESSSHAACQGIFGHSHVSWLSHCGLILS